VRLRARRFPMAANKHIHTAGLRLGETEGRGKLDHREGSATAASPANLEGAPVDGRGSDRRSERPSPPIYDLLWREGLFLGGSVGINVRRGRRDPRLLRACHTIGRLLCDQRGDRYRSRLYNHDWLAAKGAQPSPASFPC